MMIKEEKRQMFGQKLLGKKMVNESQIRRSTGSTENGWQG